MSKKIAVTTESSADISKALQKELDIHVIPMTVLICDEEFKDGVDLTAKELYEKSELYNEIPKTAGISPHDYKLVFETLTQQGFDVVHVSISGKISSCFQNALFASNSFENVFVVDSLNLSAGMAMLVYEACRLRDSGKSAMEIAAELEKLRLKISTSFLLEDTGFLCRGGRCSKAEQLTADLFSLRPSVEVVGGKLLPGKRYRGRGLEAPKKYIVRTLEEKKADKSICLLNHSGLKENEVEELVSFVRKSYPFEKIVSNEAGCCISSHCGRGCVGIIFKEQSSAD